MARTPIFTTLVLLVALFSMESKAYFLFEPGIGYNRGHYRSNKLQGIGLTAKLGLEFTTFFIAGDVGYHDLQLGSTPTSTQTDFGVALGGDFKQWKFWFTYLASASLSIESGGTTNEYTGDGIKLGIGGLVGKDAYLNLEVRFIDITEADGQPVTQFIDAGLLSISWKVL
jgi:hypothetical protein